MRMTLKVTLLRSVARLADGGQTSRRYASLSARYIVWRSLAGNTDSAQETLAIR